MKLSICKNKTHLVVTLTFAALMLLCSYLMGNNDNSGVMLTLLISAYAVISGQFVTSNPCTSCEK